MFRTVVGLSAERWGRVLLIENRDDIEVAPAGRVVVMPRVEGVVGLGLHISIAITVGTKASREGERCSRLWSNYQRSKGASRQASGQSVPHPNSTDTCQIGPE